MQIELPSRLIRARTVRVERLNCVDVNLDLDFGVQVKKRITLEGVMPKTVDTHKRDAAMHCMVVLLGGKNLLVHVPDGVDKRDGYIMGRVYLCDKVYGNPPGLRCPFGLDTELLEVGEFFQYLNENGFNEEVLKRVLQRNAYERWRKAHAS
jgi:hypothetical protein